ncbi:MAG: cobyrinate a,c-diamide synthase [Nitrospinae bacterium]|nr:cobyrinate a,c-diamide synthase [Nitrospinota bacterium]
MNNGFAALLVAGTNSGVGKTTISLALTSLLCRRGIKTRTFKVGPDFLDPTYLSLASGQPCYNLDGWMAGEDYTRRLFAEKCEGFDAAVIEGVMGLYDGASPVSIEGGTAHTAAITGAPVALVMDAKGMGGSVAALVKGYCGFTPGVNVAAVIANNCGSTRHGEVLREALMAANLPPLAGAIPRGAFPQFSSRHLGLVSADGRAINRETLDHMASAIEQYCDVELLLNLGRMARPKVDADKNRKPPLIRKTRIGVAFDEAFHFYYADTLEGLEQRGCEIVKFSPVTDAHLPEGLSGIYIGGGYPEEYAERLSSNRPMLEGIRGFNGPIYAECGGLMYLSRGIVALDDKRYPMAGLLPAGTRMRQGRKSLGYVEAELAADSVLGRAGDVLRGHRFHYSELDGETALDDNWIPAYSIRARAGRAAETEGFSRPGLMASYVHAHLASHPSVMDSFIKTCSGEQK